MGKLAEIKTKATDHNVLDFIATLSSETKRNDAIKLLQLMEKVTQNNAVLWGSGIIGFGDIIVKSPNTQREVKWFKMGFAPRKANISLYLSQDNSKYSKYIEKLGKCKLGMGCVYINKLSDIRIDVLENLLVHIVASMKT
jgi:hypothetical protein